MNLFLKGMQKLKDLLGGSKEDMRARSGSNTSAESFANNVCTGGGGVKMVTDPKGFLAVPGILRVSLTLFVSSGFDLTPFENAQRWMGKNTFHFLLLNDDNMIGEH